METNTAMKLGTKIGEGNRSKVYNHPTNNNLVIKVTTKKEEKEVADYFLNNPSSLFVTIYEIEKIGNKYYIVAEKVENADFKFKTKKGTFFLENKFNAPNYKLNTGREDYINYVKSIVIDSQIELVDEYYNFLEEAEKIGMDFFDTAWNIGLKNGKFICFDTSI